MTATLNEPSGKERLRIGIDYRLAQEKTRGMGRYIEAIVEVLKQRDDGIDFILICSKIPKDGFDPGRLGVFIGGLGNYILFEQFSLPMIAIRLKLDALWCPANTFPLIISKKIKKLVTIHDLIFLRKDIKNSPSLWQRVGKIYRSLVCRLGIGEITTIFTDSEYSVKDITSTLGRDDAVYAPVRMDCFPLHTIDNSIMERLGLHVKGYFFTVSGDAPSKNLDALLEAHKSSGTIMPLVVSGVSNPKSINTYRNIFSENVIFTGYISDEELFALYSNAGCFVFPSLAEGFGIPILEAMSWKLPIIASNRTSIPEVLGDAGQLFDPENRLALSRLLADFRLENYTDMISRQPSRLEYYRDWGKTADIIVSSMKGAFKR